MKRTLEELQELAEINGLDGLKDYLSYHGTQWSKTQLLTLIKCVINAVIENPQAEQIETETINNLYEAKQSELR